MDGRRASVRLVRPFQKAEGEVSGSIRAENKDSLSLSLVSSYCSAALLLYFHVSSDSVYFCNLWQGWL